MPLIAILTVGGFLAWTYLKTQQTSYNTIRTGTQINQLLYSVSNRVADLISFNSGNAGGSFAQACATLNNQLKTLRNLNSPVPNPLPTWAFVPDRASPNNSPGVWDCLVQNADALPATTLQKATISLSMSEPPDLANLTFSLKITVQADYLALNSAYDANSILTPKRALSTLERDYHFKAATLGDYSLVLLPQNGATQVSVSGGAQLEITGLTYQANLANPPALDQITNLSGATANVVFDQSVDIRAKSVTSTVPSLAYDSIFKGGIRLSVYGADRTSTLPFEDVPSAWSQTLDYTYSSYNTLGDPKRFGVILPNINKLPPQNIVGVADANSGYRNKFWQKNYNALPSAPINKLVQTCGISNTPLPPEFVFEDTSPSGNFTLTFPNLDDVFCGTIAANRLTVNLNGRNNYIIGPVIAANLQVNGTGKLFIINPNDNVNLPIPLPAGQSQGNIVSQFRLLAAGVGHDFFVPILGFSANSAVITNDNKLSFYRPHAPVVDYQFENGSLKLDNRCDTTGSGWFVHAGYVCFDNNYYRPYGAVQSLTATDHQSFLLSNKDVLIYRPILTQEHLSTGGGN